MPTLKEASQRLDMYGQHLEFLDLSEHAGADVCGWINGKYRKGKGMNKADRTK